MSRGAKQAFQDQTATNNQILGTGESAIKTGANTIASLPTDYTPEQKAAITQATLGTVDTGLQNAQNKAAGFAARTGATAGMPELMSQEARNAASTKAGAAAKLSEDFANVPFQRGSQVAQLQNQNAAEYSPYYGSSSGLTSNLAQQAFKPGLLSNILTGMAGGVGGGLGSALGSRLGGNSNTP